MTKTFTYYDTGNVNTAADANGGLTTYKYGACGNSFLTEVDYPLGLIAHQAWDTLSWETNCAGGIMTQSTDVNGNATNFSFTDANYWRVTGVSHPDGGSTTVAYNEGTHLPWDIASTSSKDSTTNVTSDTVLDGFGRVVQQKLTSDPIQTDIVATTYDALGRLVSVTNPYRTTGDPTYGITTFAYDALGRTASVKHPDNSQLSYSYTGSATQVQDEGSGGTAHITRVYQADGMGRMVSVCEVSSTTMLGAAGTPAPCSQDIAATGFLTSYVYDALGNITTVLQPGMNNRTYSYDDLSRLLQEVNPESGTTTYTYDAAGQQGDLYQRTRPKQNQTGTATVVTTYTFDKLHRSTGRSYNDSSTPSATLSYDQASVGGVIPTNPKGNLTNAIVGTGTTAGTIFSYDPMGRINQEWQCTPVNCGTGTFSLQYSYDYLGDVTRLINGKENVTYTYSYDTAARLTKLQSSLIDANHPGTLFTVNTYNPLGEITQATLGNGVIRNLGYDNRGRLTSLADGSIYSFTLGYAGDSNILTGNDSVNGNWTYTYDPMERLSTASKTGNAFNYRYDPNGNRWQQNVTVGGGPQPQYTFDANNHIVTSGYSYDAAGNLLNDTFHAYTYDAEARLLTVDGTAAAYTYDAFGQRVRSTIGSQAHDFIFQGGAATDQITGATWDRGELFLGGLHVATYNNSVNPATTYFEHQDWVGAVRARSSVSGASVETCASLFFGDNQSCIGTDVSPLHYATLAWDSESNLQHAWFRQDSTTQGRWTTPDPSGLSAVDASNPQTWNRYSYVQNNPTIFVDPLGLNDCEQAIDCGTGSGTCVEWGCEAGYDILGALFGWADVWGGDTAATLQMFGSALVNGDVVLLPGYQCAETTSDYICWNNANWNPASRGGRAANNGTCGITVKCRGIQTDNLGKVGMQHCDAQVTDSSGQLWSLSGGPQPNYMSITALNAWATSPPTEPFTGTTVYQGNSCTAAGCMIQSTQAWNKDVVKPEYRPVTGPNSNTWLKGTAAGCGVSLPINTWGSIW